MCISDSSPSRNSKHFIYTRNTLWPLCLSDPFRFTPESYPFTRLSPLIDFRPSHRYIYIYMSTYTAYDNCGKTITLNGQIATCCRVAHKCARGINFALIGFYGRLGLLPIRAADHVVTMHIH